MFDTHSCQGIQETASHRSTSTQRLGQQNPSLGSTCLSNYDSRATAAQVQAQHVQKAVGTFEVGHETRENEQEPYLSDWYVFNDYNTHIYIYTAIFLLCMLGKKRGGRKMTVLVGIFLSKTCNRGSNIPQGLLNVLKLIKS